MLFKILCFVLCVNKLVAAVPAGKCDDTQFACSGGCIYNYRVCDGIRDCKDGSDEIFGTCFNTTCTGFRCNYGGCVDSLALNETQSKCLDESDLNPFLIADDDEMSKLVRRMRGDCSNLYAFECPYDKKCLKLSELCNGHQDCADGKDETADLCTFNTCPSNAFRCEYGGCIDKHLACNHKSDCFDQSDENKIMCLKIRSNETEWKVDCCGVELGPGMEISDLFLDYPLQNKQRVPEGTYIEVRCKEGYQLSGKAITTCVGSNWKEMPSCDRECPQKSEVRSIQYSTQCIETVPIACTQNKFRESATLTVTCAPGYKSTEKNVEVGEHYCVGNGTWTTKRANPSCEPVCGITSVYHSELTPWTVSIFQRMDSQPLYKFICLGTILSAHLILTARSCIRDTKRNNHLSYTIVEGRSDVEFSLNDEHSYVLHNVSKVHSLVPQASILQLVKPFRFGDTIRPVCLKDKTPDTKVNPTDFKFGEGLVVNVDDTFSLTHFMDESENTVPVNMHLKQIRNLIKETEIFNHANVFKIQNLN
ncbi:modular serine protease [Drosophila busckii]|uniref:modular serine protease n=1 Tax=Drosophila busckii TaxID=30019 RepID=UPI0014329304|nr:modular serine protease [Drosophila busckii]